MSTPKKKSKNNFFKRGGGGGGEGVLGIHKKKIFGQMGLKLFFFQQKFVIFPTKKMGIFSRVKLTNFADVLRKNWNFLISKLKKRNKRNLT